MILWFTIGAIAVINFVFKGLGPAVLGGRELPERRRAVIALVAPSLLAGFVVVDVAGPGWSVLDPTVLAGLAAVLMLRWYRLPLPLVILSSVVVTALLRLWTA